jgi:hypothetical protein
MTRLLLFEECPYFITFGDASNKGYFFSDTLPDILLALPIRPDADPGKLPRQTTVRPLQ